ncbi:caspase-8 [Neolamprologus brichardi]|uniref:caspase-8 n=1 Tax=Neolamprologus brichardi TaxID=32507 RepID=UPI0003EC027F|nr:caspase-8 [Neolamprologus brichardi]XP_006788501.1 caspase-8 [Neolamprologus brichardi]
MEFQNFLLKVGKALSKDEVKALVFLCTDLLDQKPNKVETASELFSCLMKQDHLSPENPQLLTELLVTTEHHALIRDLCLAPRTTTSLISPYRKLLYSLSEEITDDDLREVKFLLNTMIPRRKLGEHITTLEVFLEMERIDLLSESNLNTLETIVKEVCPMLNAKINQFKKRRVTCPVMTTDAISTQEKESVTMPISPSTNTQDEGLGTYPMTSEKRGICLIVNNDNFSNSSQLKKREGTAVDQKCLQSVFQWLGFKVESHHDCDTNEMLSVFKELGKRDHSRFDCVVCCVLSHGVEGSVYGVDGSTVKISDLTDLFNGLNCPSLVGKPKLFFIQACQGNSEQQAVFIESDSSAYSFHWTDAIKAKQGIPNSADFLLGMATVPFHVSFRERTNGTWFIQSLCQNLVQMVPREFDLMSILTKVNADVSKKSDQYGQRKQMPQPAFSLRKKVVFPVPNVPPPSIHKALSNS